MIVRTYGRRNRGGSLSRSLSDPYNEEEDNNSEDPFELSVYQDEAFLPSSSSSSQDLFLNPFSFPFSSQESSSLFPSSYSSSPLDPNKSKKRPRDGPAFAHITNSTTLMEAQEYGEMMEHVDEVNFALDGLRKCQPVRVRRASLLSLLAICGTPHQRRLLRTQGLSRTIMDAILVLGHDDSPSNLAAAALFYALTVDGQDDHLLELPLSINFLLKLLKPVISAAPENKVRNIGSKLLALRKDSDILRDSSRLVDSSLASILARVQELLVSCKDMKSPSGSNRLIERPELDPKWISLLTMEKACLSKISLEDISGTVKETGSNFKEKLRELGGLDTVFDVMMDCHSVMENWALHGRSAPEDRRDDSRFQSLMLLMKCLKIMENATFLSKDNQSYLLEMERKLDSGTCRLFFTELLIGVIKVLSGLCLRKSSATCSDGKPSNFSDGYNRASDVALLTDCEVENRGVIYISSSTDCCSRESTSIENGCCASLKSSVRLGISASSSEAKILMNGTRQPKMKSSSSMPFSFSGTKTKVGVNKRSNCTKDTFSELLEDSQDPYAFDEEEFQPSKWDLLYGKKTSRSRVRKGGQKSREYDKVCQSSTISPEDRKHSEDNQPSLIIVDDCHWNGDASSLADDEECSSLLADCLLTTVKVLMNLTNDNPIGCKQIAASGGLETMSSLIAGHFPSFSSSLSFDTKINEDVTCSEVGERSDFHLSDQELDFLVAILGLLVNLVEKDGNNRSRLAAASVSLRGSEGLMEDTRKDVIPLLCSIFLTNQGAADTSGEGNLLTWNDEAAVLQGEKEAEMMIIEAYAALLLAFLSTESKCIRDSIANCLPSNNLAVLVPVLERFVAFHMTLNMISPETHKAVTEVIESCRVP